MSLNDSVLEIKQLEESLLKAMRLRKLSFLEDIFSRKYVFLASDGSTWGRDKALDDYRNPRFELSKIETHNQQIVMHENMAIVTGVSLIAGKIGENPLSGRYFFMRVWCKEKDDWKIIAVSTNNAAHTNFKK